MKHCLAYRILIQDPISSRARLVILIEILGDMISSNQCPPLAHNQAAHALIDGFFHLIQTYLKHGGENKKTAGTDGNNTVRIAGAYLSIALLDTLAIDQRNHQHIIRNRKQFAEITGNKLISSGNEVHAKISEAARDLWEKISSNILIITKELFLECESTLRFLAELVSRNGTGSKSAIVILGGFATSMSSESHILPAVVKACTKSLESQISAAASPPLSTTGTTTAGTPTAAASSTGTDEAAFLAYMLAANCTAYVRNKKEFVQALVKRAGNDYTQGNGNNNIEIWNSNAVKALGELHREKSLAEYKQRIAFFFKDDAEDTFS